MAWLSLTFPTQIYSEKEHVGQKEIQNAPFGGEKDTRKLNAIGKACAEER